MNYIWILYFIVLVLIPTFINSDRRKAARGCSRRWRLQSNDKEFASLVFNGLDGSFVDYNLNSDENRLGHNNPNDEKKSKIIATTYGNQRIDAYELGSPSPEALPLEGRSFCVSGEHFKNADELFRQLNFGGMAGLARRNFDIGTHTDPSDYSLMNIFPWSDWNLDINKPTTSIFSKTAKDGELIYVWEDTTETFFHTKVSRNKSNLFPVRHIHQGFRKRPSVLESQPNRDCRNPYFIDVTEIDANGVRLHNWLHITVYVKRENIIKKPNCPTGRMRYIMLEVRDSLGLPIGDFNADVNCGTSCKCKSANCKMVNGAFKNGMPCMFTPLRAITQPGLFMYNARPNDYFDEVHVSWHFAQHTSYFAYQLHFAALIVENATPTRYYNSRQTTYQNPLFCHKEIFDCEKITNYRGAPVASDHKFDSTLMWIYTEKTPYYYSENPDYGNSKSYTKPPGSSKCVFDDLNEIDYSIYSNFASRKANPNKPYGYYAFTLQHIANKSRPYGFTAQYTMLSPTIQTLGAWDIFRPKYVQISRMNCHKKLDNEFFEEHNPTKGKLPTKKDFFTFRRDYFVHGGNLTASYTYGEDKIYNKEIAVNKSVADTSDYHSKYSDVPIGTDYGDWNDTMNPNSTYNVPQIYFGTEFTRAVYERYEADMPIEIKNNLRNRRTFDFIALQERCACPALATTQDPEAVTRPAHQLQGRGTHSTQMLLAWVVMVPIGLFTIRYYKETYSRVFLLQEFWWYSVHALCTGTAWIFMMGGIYAIEIKRLDGDNYAMSDEAFAHIIIGSAAVAMFTLHLFIAPLRLWSVKWRVVQIILHFTFGIIEYAFAVVSILLAAAIPQGRMSCSAFYIYVSFLVIQAVFYALMEAHMSYVDKLLDLFPSRTYLPPPVMRLFHRSAPLSKIRIYILGFYVIFCWIYFHILQGQTSTHIASCFKNLGNDYEEESF